MRRLLAIVVVSAVALASPAAAQRFRGVPAPNIGHTLGPPASVTSIGFGHSLGPAASVTSPGFGQPFGRHLVFRRHGFFNPAFRHFRHSFVPFFSVAVPVAVPFFDYGTMEYEQPSLMQPAQPQPIVIVVPSTRTDTPLEAQPQPPAPPEPDARAQGVKPAAPAASQPEELPKPLPTTIVLRDGHRFELTDYALIGNTLYDLREGRTKKISLAEVDLPATIKANEENGVEFVVPASANR